VRTIENIKGLLARAQTPEELEYLTVYAYELSKTREVSFTFPEAFELVKIKFETLSREEPSLNPYYLFIRTSLERYANNSNLDYDGQKKLLKKQLTSLTSDQLYHLLTIKLPAILDTDIKSDYFK